jgi:hypothetical protein
MRTAVLLQEKLRIFDLGKITAGGTSESGFFAELSPGLLIDPNATEAVFVLKSHRASLEKQHPLETPRRLQKRTWTVVKGKIEGGGNRALIFF